MIQGEKCLYCCSSLLCSEKSFYRCPFPFSIFFNGVPPEFPLWATVRHKGIIDKAGAWYTVDDNLVQGRDGTKSFLLDRPDIRERVEAEIFRRAAELGSFRNQQPLGA